MSWKECRLDIGNNEKIKAISKLEIIEIAFNIVLLNFKLF
jgi:hypothetical protein